MTAQSAADTPLVIVAPAAPGGGWDQTARAMQRAFAEVEPGASVQVENVAGAAGTIGLARFVTGERGNPHALLITGLVMVGGIVTNRAPRSLAETTPIARLTGEAEVIVVPAASTFRTLDDLLAAFRAAPQAVAWGGGSAGGTDDLLVRLIAHAIGVPAGHVSYIAFPGGGAALAALLGGQVTAGVSGYGEFAGQIEAGTLRVLAISSPTRVAGAGVRTLAEQGVDVELSNWRGVVAPPGLSDAERDALTARVERLAASEAWRSTLARSGWEDMLLTGTAFRQFLLAEQQRVAAVLLRLDTGPGSNGHRWAVPTPATAPMLVVVALVVLSAVRLYDTSKRKAGRIRATGAQEREIDPTPLRMPWQKPIGLVAVLAVHAVTFQFVGFVPASALLFVVTAMFFGSRRPLRDVALGLATAFALYGLFTRGLGVMLPPDPLTRWLLG
jgi:putative tricarboxylic transport membrane protein